jgi:D-alanyl-D-alanine carboxypeptidase
MHKNLQKLLDSTVDGKRVFGAALCVDDRKNRFTWEGSAGNLGVDSRYFIASTTKIYITALVLILEQERKLNLDDPISKHLPRELISALDPTITVSQLLAHTSGLTDYFQNKPKGKPSLEKQITQGFDQAWTCEQAVQMSVAMGPMFPPGKKGKAHYSDTNYQLLGRIVERIEESRLAQILQRRLFSPLGFKQTYLYLDPTDPRPASLYFKDKPLHIPQAMASFGADGGIVSTARESLAFIQAFFDGRFFPKERLPGLMIWNRIFFPFTYGIGLMRFKLPWIFSPFRTFPEFLGHSGLSGAFAFFCPDREIFLAGTVNQISPPSLSFQLMLKTL